MQFGGAEAVLSPANMRIIETYPALIIIALNWTLKDSLDRERLPKYNPARRRSFSHSDWKHVCIRASSELKERGLVGIANWIDRVSVEIEPRKRVQDCLDACICLLAATYFVEEEESLMIGDLDTGYIVVPNNDALRDELDVRCERTGRRSAEWVRKFQS